MKVVYILGCLGFIGSHLTQRCLELGWEVMGVDKETYASNKFLLEKFGKYKNFSYICSDINDLKFLYDCDYVINTAAETHVGNSIVDSDEFVKSNIDGVHNLLKLLKNHRGENAGKPILLHFSTDEVYGDIANGSFDETALLKPSNPYSATKAAGDMLITAFSRTYNIPYIIVRPSNNYGLYQYVEKLIPKTIKYLKWGKPIPLHNMGKPYRHWLHVEDTVDAILTIIEKGKVGEIYNIPANIEMKNIDVVEKIIKEYFSLTVDPVDYENFIDFSLKRPGQDIRYSVDGTKLKKLGWEPIHNFNVDLVGIVDYYKTNFIW